jgi:type 1 glutamine amidotransferase
MRARRLIAALCLAAVVVPASLASARPAVNDLDVLVYSATYGFRHASIETAKKQFTKLGRTAAFDVTLSEDPSIISKGGLAPFDVVVFLNATGEHPFSRAQRAAFLKWVEAGNGVVATHASIDGNYYWSDYGEIVGAYFLAHPHTGTATNVVEDRRSPFTRHFDTARYELNEEYYRFQLDPRDNVHVLTSLDKSTAGTSGATYEDAQPTTFCQRVAGGRSFTTAWGHFDASFTNPDVWRMLVQGVRWAGGRIDANCSPTRRTPAGRLDAEEANHVSFGRKETSSEKGAEQVVTKILHNGYLKFSNVDLTGVKTLRARVSVETAPEPRPYHVPAPQPAAGGTITMRLDRLRKADTGTPTRAVATVTVPPSSPGWKTIEVPIRTVSGVHDVYFEFSEQVSGWFASSRIVAPEATDSRYLMSVDWLEAR